MHDRGVSWVEGVMSRGDRRVADAVELAWKRGARFDSWSECFDLRRWEEVFAECGVVPHDYLGTRPITARLPWDHIDVGLDEGFLLAEYRKAVKSRLSPPCGKVRGHLVHHSNIEEATAESGKLVCYDCGVACDLSNMKAERLVYLRSLGAEKPSPPSEKVVRATTERGGSKHPMPRPEDEGLVTRRIRLRYTKLGRITYLGHLDTMRVLIRLFRRADIDVAYSKGFSPKPNMEFAPALPLGVSSFGELADVVIVSELAIADIHERLREVSPEGLTFTGCWDLEERAKGLSKLIERYEVLIAPAAGTEVWDADRLCAASETFMAKESAMVARKRKEIDVRSFVESVEVLDSEAATQLCAILDWPEVPALLQVKVQSTPNGSTKPVEVCEAMGLSNDETTPGAVIRLARLGFGGEALDDEELGISVEHGMRKLLPIAAAPQAQL
jgi:radical SAM-linked protein